MPQGATISLVAMSERSQMDNRNPVLGRRSSNSFHYYRAHPCRKYKCSGRLNRSDMTRKWQDEETSLTATTTPKHNRKSNVATVSRERLGTLG
mmetsp:Transcript_18544/g.51570  ORF Transcript_18544/g.51570 Transcript_18544/m.51570 type:complete len:93 (+) Transcript_18544:214-492(+)